MSSGSGVEQEKINSILKDTVRSLRKHSTEAEQKFWHAVRNRKIDGYKFLRQHPIQCTFDGYKRFFIADFYCAKRKLIVEIDGLIHKKQKDYDELRTYIIERFGMKVIRFKNYEIEKDINRVIRSLKKELD